jgi:phage shock protein PspC (stress-responsive transcriptional regulator)
METRPARSHRQTMAKTPQNKRSKKQEETTEVGPRRPLLRSRSDRMIWGVAGGLAAHVGFDPILVRIAFVVTTFFGGAGLLAYLVLAVALPEDDGTGKPVPEGVGARLAKVLLVVILVSLALAAAGFLAAVSAWTAATGHGTVIAGIVIALGLALVAVAFAANARRRIIPWLVTAALVLGIPAGAVAAADIEIDGSIGQREYTPTVVADIPDSGYELGTGQLIVDLRRLPWQKGQTIPVTADLGFGQMIVSVPTRVCVDAQATAKGGDLVIAGEVSNGMSPEVDQGRPTTDAPRLDLDAEVQFGQVIVTDQAPDQVDSRRGVDFDHHQEELESQRVVCGR